MMKKILTLLIFVILSVSMLNFALASDPLNPDDANIDSDNDGLKNWEEYLNGTDPNNADSDNDGVPDGWEVFSDMDAANPADAHEDLDFQATEPDEKGEIEAQFSAVRHSFDVWPSDGVTQVAADLHYDNYEEYYRAFDTIGGVTVPVFYAYTDPQAPDTDGDRILDPDDYEPHNYANDGTSYHTTPTNNNHEYNDNTFDSYTTAQKLKTINAIDTLHNHDTLFIDSDLFTSIKF
jgi:hypothetical protein